MRSPPKKSSLERYAAAYLNESFSPRRPGPAWERFPLIASQIHALVIGPLDTPYEGGFFHFFIKCPTDYPIAPPRVRLMTTDRGRVRFNPNLYACGKVCLSILGTWSGPSWSAAQGLGSVLVSIQNPGDAARYNAIIQHETVRVAVCDTVESCLLENCILPPALSTTTLPELVTPGSAAYVMQRCRSAWAACKYTPSLP
ncbi:hypothetical protein HPB48_013748 [Haemaphysalis longicornis]|uniref:Ubiquitin-conjugating enzyme E2 Z n=1 Tax=Haemaphysalis longicornis TaxID=44386 RepID=A0A9J6FPK6_HAELO|nr:hypothetical protein HPB48_013748 [Haemaphysalis longicornis]